MMGRTKNIVTGLVCIAAAAACVPNGDAPEPMPREAYVCPADGYLNCMPIVPAERRSYCSADYTSWIVSNCPNVEIVY